MNANEYIEIFKKILELTEEIEILCKRKNFDDIEDPFNKRDSLFEKLDILPDEITKDQLELIKVLKNTISEKNKFILKSFKTYKNELKMDIALSSKENKVIEAYKINSVDFSNSIFNLKE